MGRFTQVSCDLVTTPLLRQKRQQVTCWNETPVKFTVVDAQLVTLDLTMFNHQPRSISVSGQKTWEDQNNIMNTRPAAITIDLYRNGQKD